MDVEQIVRALAVADAPVEAEFGQCMLCPAEFRTRDEGYKDPARHKPDCPWRLAREWVAANPATG
jgi:hypothetical protein